MALRGPYRTLCQPNTKQVPYLLCCLSKKTIVFFCFELLLFFNSWFKKVKGRFISIWSKAPHLSEHCPLTCGFEQWSSKGEKQTLVIPILHSLQQPALTHGMVAETVRQAEKWGLCIKMGKDCVSFQPRLAVQKQDVSPSRASQSHVCWLFLQACSVSFGFWLEVGWPSVGLWRQWWWKLLFKISEELSISFLQVCVTGGRQGVASRAGGSHLGDWVLCFTKVQLLTIGLFSLSEIMQWNPGFWDCHNNIQDIQLNPNLRGMIHNASSESTSQTIHGTHLFQCRKWILAYGRQRFQWAHCYFTMRVGKPFCPSEVTSGKQH